MTYTNTAPNMTSLGFAYLRKSERVTTRSPGGPDISAAIFGPSVALE